MSQCFFCAIADGSAGVPLLADRDGVVAFRDINPQAPTHVLLMPVEHIDSAARLTEANGPLLGRLFSVAAAIAEQDGLANGWRLVSNVGPDAGQSVKHLHVHLLGGRSMAWPPG